MRKLAVIAILLVLAATAFSRPEEVRYRVTVEVDDGGTIRSGSSVWSFALSKSILPLAGPYNPRFRGEAVAVELPGRGTLFALTRDGGKYPENLFGDQRRPKPGPAHSSRVEDLKQIKTMIGSRASLDCLSPAWIGVRCPTFIRFRNLQDPQTMETIEPAKMSSHFGPGVRIKGVYISITNDNVTSGIDRVIPWLNKLDDILKDESNKLTPQQSSDIGYLRIK